MSVCCVVEPRNGYRARLGVSLGVAQADLSRMPGPARNSISHKLARKRALKARSLTIYFVVGAPILAEELIFGVPMRSAGSRQDVESQLHGQNRSQNNDVASQSEP